MLYTVYVIFNGDMYEITADILGEIVQVVVYRDNKSRVGESLSVKDLPIQVFTKAQTEISKRWSEK